MSAVAPLAHSSTRLDQLLIDISRPRSQDTDTFHPTRFDHATNSLVCRSEHTSRTYQILLTAVWSTTDALPCPEMRTKGAGLTSEAEPVVVVHVPEIELTLSGMSSRGERTRRTLQRRKSGVEPRTRDQARCQSFEVYPCVVTAVDIAYGLLVSLRRVFPSQRSLPALSENPGGEHDGKWNLYESDVLWNVFQTCTQPNACVPLSSAFAERRYRCVLRGDHCVSKSFGGSRSLLTAARSQARPIIDPATTASAYRTQRR